jgi:hypothetical protein
MSSFTFESSIDRVVADELADFIRSQITGKLSEVPGISYEIEGMLNKSGVFNTYQLIGKYLSMKRMEEDLLDHHVHFLNYLGYMGISKAEGHRITQSIGEKVSTMIPGLYDPSIFVE